MTSVDPIATALLVTAVLDALGVPYTIGGSIASSFAGEPRATVDIDIVAAIEERHVDAFVEALTPQFYADAASVRRAIRTRTSTNLIHQATHVKVDVFVSGGSPLDARQLARRQAVDLGPGRRVYVHPPEDILLQKLRWFRLGGEVSDRQWRDIAAIVRVQGSRLDTTYLREAAPILDVADLLERALAQGDR